MAAVVITQTQTWVTDTGLNKAATLSLSVDVCVWTRVSVTDETTAWVKLKELWFSKRFTRQWVGGFGYTVAFLRVCRLKRTQRSSSGGIEAALTHLIVRPEWSLSPRRQVCPTSELRPGKESHTGGVWKKKNTHQTKASEWRCIYTRRRGRASSGIEKHTSTISWLCGAGEEEEEEEQGNEEEEEGGVIQ